MQEQMSKGHKNIMKKKESEEARTYLKACATFKCSSEDCGKIWNSIHAWKRKAEEIVCHNCYGKGVVYNIRDENLLLDNYECNNPNCQYSDDRLWQSISNGKSAPQPCDLCNLMVTPNGDQIRFGRHYWLKCTNEGCKDEWEDFSTNKQRTQHCGTCHGRGTIISLCAMPRWWRKSKGKKGSSRNDADGTGRHDKSL